MRRAPLAGFAAVVCVVAALAVVPAAASTCAPPYASDPMPDGGGHDHSDPLQHAFTCGIDPVAHLDLSDVVPEPTMFGEVDVAGDIAVIATAWPEGGFVVLDVSDPTDPEVLSRFYGPRCEELYTDIDCGADVKLTPDGRTAFIAVQNIYRTPGLPQNAQALAAPSEPGIIVVDLTDPRLPLMTSWLPVEPWGVHMHEFHEIGGRGYLFMIDNLHGLRVARLEGTGPAKALVPVHLSTEGLSNHDVFLYDDPADGKTYLYVAAAYNGLTVYDVSDPSQPVRVGAWIPPPPTQGQWYVHSVRTLRWGDRRYTFVVPEQFRTSGARQPGPVWLLDTTSHAAPSLVGTWTNPSGRWGGNLAFSPHNISLAPDGHLWLAHYHGGVWLLDWRPVLGGQVTRPIEVGYHVPHAVNRPFVTSMARVRFITGFDLLRRPSIWDVEAAGPYAYASDITGGLVVLRGPP